MHDDDITSEENLSPTLLREFISHNLNFKGVVYQTPDEGKFEVCVYEWQPEKDAKEEPVWERVSGPIFVDTYPHAESLAEENMRLFSGELIDSAITPEMTSWLKEYSQDEAAEYLNPKNYTVQFLLVDENTPENQRYEEISAQKIAIVHDFYIVESQEKWLLGRLANEGQIECWQEFKTLENILDILKNDI